MKMDLNLILVFLEVYQFHSYTRASESLGITQPAVSAAIKRMEKELGERLFIREGSGMKPTAVAIRLAGRFEKGLHEIENALSDRSKFTVFISEILALELPEIPEVIFEQTPTDQEDLLNRIKNLSVDFAVGLFAAKDPSLITESIFSEQAAVVCRKNHPRIQGSMNQEQFFAEEHVVNSTRLNGMDGFEHFTLISPLERKIGCRLSSVSGMLLHVSRTDRLCVVSTHIANQWKEVLNLQVLTNPILHKNMEYQLAYHNRYQHSERHTSMRKKVVDMILKNINKQ